MNTAKVVYYDNGGDIIEYTPKIELDIDSKFSSSELSLIRDEISQIKKELDLFKQARVGGEILGSMIGVADVEKVILLSEYIDQIIFKIQSKIN